MKHRLYRLAMLALAPMIATGCGKDDTGTNPEGDADTDSDSDSDADTDSDADADYGAPSIRYLLSGSVTNAATGAPIQGIELDFQGWTADSTKEGVWSMDTAGVDYCGDKCLLNAADVDGKDNGVFEQAQVTLDPTQTTGHDPHEGTYEQFDIAVQMNRLDSEDTAVPVEEP